MKNLIGGALLGSALTLVTVIAILAVAPPNQELCEDGSYTFSSDAPFTNAGWN
jgi:hypothetical protein